VVTKSKLNNPKLRRSFGSVSLKTLFQQGDIPPWYRNDFPLLASQGELVAIPGIASEEKRKDESAQTESTTWCRAILTN
jgi:tRNA(Ile)-lysidine synthetase-like protein